MYIIGMNGPPRSGKDSIGKRLGQMLTERREIVPLILALSQPIRESVYALLGVQYAEEHYEANKDLPQALFGGKSIRQVMIDLSEKFVKPLYGQDFWSRRADVSIHQWEDTVTIITDFGFPPEREFFAGEYGLNCNLLVRLHRDGFDFRSDSRDYLLSHANVIDVDNDGTIDDAAEKIYEMLIALGWQL